MKAIVRHTDRKSNRVSYKLNNQGRELGYIEYRASIGAWLGVAYINGMNCSAYTDTFDSMEEAIDFIDDLFNGKTTKVYWN